MQTKWWEWIYIEDFNIHFSEHIDIVFNNKDKKKEDLMNKFEKSLRLTNINIYKGIEKNLWKRLKINKSRIIQDF